MQILNIPGIPVYQETDVLVIGAGSAGCSAAVAAACTGGGKVTLIDRAGFPGGISTQALDTFYGFFTPGDAPRKVAGGIGDCVPGFELPTDKLQSILREQGAILEMPTTPADISADGWGNNF